MPRITTRSPYLACVVHLAQSRGALLEPMTDIMAHTFRCRAETIQILKAVEAGADLAAGMTRERAVRMLTESIVFYEQMLRRYGWGLDARLSSKQR
jgi:hypothetical protein